MSQSNFDEPSPDKEESPNSFKQWLNNAKNEVKELGGWVSFTTGRWLLPLIQKSIKNYLERGTAEYFEEKYKTKDVNFLVKKLTNIAAKNAMILGAVTGAAISIDEIAAIATAVLTLPTAGGATVPLAAEIAIAATALMAEVVLLMRIQLQLVANIAKLHRVPLDPEDPEDILTILAFATGGAVAEEAGRFGMKVGGKLAGVAAKTWIKKDILIALKKIAAKVGIKVLQRSIMKYVVPGASMLVGSGWNYLSTRAISKIAAKHFSARGEGLNS